MRIAKDATYDVVIGNPPYQGLSKTDGFSYVLNTYPRGKADLYAAFLERGLELTKPGGVSALVTMRGWMFLSNFDELRKHLLGTADLRVLADLDRGAFSEIAAGPAGVSVCMSSFRRVPPERRAVALRAFEDGDTGGVGILERRQAFLLAQVGRHEFDTQGFEVIAGEPIVYWWTRDLLEKYARTPKVSERAPVRQGLGSADNGRYLRRPFELSGVRVSRFGNEPLSFRPEDADWAPYIKGGAGRVWVEPLSDLIRWRWRGLELKLAAEARYGSYTKRIINEQFYFKPGVAFTKIGTSFDARMHRYRSVIDVAGSSVFPRDAVDVAKLLCLMNSPLGRFVLQSLNPTVNFQVGDVSRLPVFSVEQADVVVDNIESAFAEHERGCESDLAFKSPRPSPWTHAQAWAQAAVARPEGSPLPKFTPACDPVAPETIVSWTIGVALGRFGPSDEGVLDVAPVGALPNGILFVSSEGADSLDHAACAPIVNAWKEHGAAVGQGDDLRTYLRTSYFALHKRLYETRPIYFPLTSKGKNFVGLVSIHRLSLIHISEPTRPY